MAQDSRNTRKARRAKIERRLAAQTARKTNRQIIQRLEERLVHTQFTLLTMLLEHGDSAGGITVAKETATLAMTDFTHLAWRADKQEDGTIRVELHDRRTVVAEAPEAPVVPVGSVTAQLAAAEAPVNEQLPA